jgi:hypothetical protein
MMNTQTKAKVTARAVTKAKVKRDLKQAFANDSNLLPSIAGRIAPDDTCANITKEDFFCMVETGAWNDDLSYEVLYYAYWRVTSITSAFMCSPNLLGSSYMPDAQLSRMADFIVRQYDRLKS